MKTTTCSLLIIISLLQLVIPVNTEETLDSIIKKLKEALSYGGYLPSTVNRTPSCTSVKAVGRLASCPAGMIATGCSCGFACGSWNIQNENICHCLCLFIDWTVARCCQLRK
ncbi:resistin-like alpha [Peromyscus californicus insignis]|uniref:resistin-like alpha n=1 Tax=Peromyscus californicus insignis TaxID=564181 RepID=UPI0022A6870B|nr:resistin-like alpha [Peromyscus californicus insignis]